MPFLYESKEEVGRGMGYPQGTLPKQHSVHVGFPEYDMEHVSSGNI